MLVELINNSYRYDIQSLCLLFFPREGFKEENSKKLTVSLFENRVEAVLVLYGTEYKETEFLNFNLYDSERTHIKRAAYNVMSKAVGIFSKWGIITGIRPALLYEKLILACGTERAGHIFKDIYGVSEEKINLCTDVLENREIATEINKQGSTSFYISIPFCPSRCRYCSFVSSDTQKEKQLIPEYVDILCDEIACKADNIKNDGKTPLTVYVGGGTPTTLDNQDLKKLLISIEKNLLKRYSIKEFTFEAGRPDTITEEKLNIMDAFGVTRISVNPQSLNDEVLREIGRNHSVEDFFKAYELALKFNFFVNVDLIAGLPKDSIESFIYTIDNIIKLNPANITLHTLYLKRAADFGDAEIYTRGKTASQLAEIENMLLYAQKNFYKNGYGPYYLYRQKNTMGNLENVGYSKKGAECLYNIYMMDDLHDIYAAGAGAISKHLGKDKKIQRINNTKFAYNYINEYKNLTDKLSQKDFHKDEFKKQK